MEILPGRVRLIVDFDDITQMAAFVRRVDEQGSFGSEVDACQVTTANPVTATSDITQDRSDWCPSTALSMACQSSRSFRRLRGPGRGCRTKPGRKHQLTRRPASASSTWRGSQELAQLLLEEVLGPPAGPLLARVVAAELGVR